MAEEMDQLALLRSERTALAELTGADLTASIAACPGWSLHDLFAHLSMVHRMAMRMMATPPTADPAPPSERPPASDADNGFGIWQFLDDGMARLIDEFERTDPTTPCRSFVGPGNVAWWLRRQLHETTVHRWDAQHAVSSITDTLADDSVVGAALDAAIDAEVAVDGIDEWLDLHPGRGWTPPNDLRGTIHLHATDGDGEWFIELGDTLAWRHGHQKGDVALRGSRSDLFLACWGRVPASELDVVGDVTLFGRFLDSLSRPAH